MFLVCSPLLPCHVSFCNACIIWLILEPHLVVNLLLVSRNFNTITALGIEYASIFVNDYEHKLAWYPNGISMEFVVLNALTGELFVC
jgi:hypothetical protein